MILSFADRRTEALYINGEAKNLPDFVVTKSLRHLDVINQARQLVDASLGGLYRMSKVPRSKPTQYRVQVYGQWWISFRWDEGNAYDVSLEKSK